MMYSVCSSKPICDCRPKLVAKCFFTSTVFRRVRSKTTFFHLGAGLDLGPPLSPAHAMSLSLAERERRAKELLKSLGLAEKAREYPDRLSGGQQQRVAIARALATEPKVLLLDEITSALDPVLVAEVLETLRSLALSGMTMLIATHEMAFAADVADRICYLEGGRLIEEGTPENIFGAPRDPRTKEFLRRVRAISAPGAMRHAGTRVKRTVRAKR